MAFDVTVLGASKTTVTIPFNSSTNAAAAQNALNTISNMVTAGTLSQFNYPGTGSVPAPAPSISGGVVISGSGAVDLGILPSGIVSVVDNGNHGSPGVAGTVMVGTAAPMTVAAATGGIQFLNIGPDAQVFLGGGTSFLGNAGAGTSMTVGVDGGDTHYMAWAGAATINAYNDTLVQVLNGDGKTAVFANGNNLVNVVGAGTAASVFGIQSLGGPATPPPGNLGFIGGADSSTYLAPGYSNVTVAAGSGNLTMVGGAGDALVFANHGLIDGGGGSNYLISDSLAGATTLMSAGVNDVLIGQGAGNTYTSGGTNAIIADLSDPNSAGGATYNTDGGSATIMGSVASNSTFNLGAGSVLAYGQHGLDFNRGSTYTDAYDGANQITIGDFVAGLDVFSLSHSASHATLSSIQFYADAGTSAFGAAGTQAILSDGTKINFLQFHITSSSFT